MAEQNNNTGNPGQTSNNQEQTFNQEQVNEIVKGRVADVKKRYADYDTLKEKAAKYDEIQNSGKSDLQKANERADGLEKELNALKTANATREVRTKVAKETGVPEHLLTGNDEESCKAQAKNILEFAKPNSYPGTKKNSKNNSGAGSSQQNDSMREFARSIFGKGE